VSDATLEQLQASGDYKTLWSRALPLTKYAISTLIRSGKIAKEQADDDFFQECCLAAGEAVRRWDPTRASFSRWVFLKVQGAALNTMRGIRLSVAPLDESRTPSDRLDIVGLLETKQDLTKVKNALKLVSPESREMLERRYGIGRAEESVMQIARSKGVVRMTVHRMLVQAQTEFAAHVH
jgi:RNA polymerase sigma factor (sigma-70 family)